ncbi:LytR/AlgR family response regulator transcription factor [Spirosoma panaciterrae]|uniref:LytR/AlgR family response regulator transcription factor n=1 Tax=Spirosoma panaciterrae TaxID=496058 RepID=UPI00036E6F7D|nr:LytTR family DNA-binding domain-containing protein [Spirosoma panaciterrae]
MTILIIEDEEPTARKLQRLLGDIDSTLSVVGMTGSVDESVAWLKSNPMPDLIFMDIELADGQSFEIVNQVPITSPVIFTTAYDEYAIKAFTVNSIDYLLKPIKEEEVRNALTKLQRLRQVLTLPAQTDGKSALETSLANLLQQFRQIAEAPNDSGYTATRPLPASFRDRFLIRQGQRLFSVNVHEIAYFFSRNKLSFLKTHDSQEWLVDYTIDELAHMLDPQQFFRLNRQVIAQLEAVDKVHLYFNGKLKVSLLPAFDDDVVVSRDKAGELKRWLGE